MKPSDWFAVQLKRGGLRHARENLRRQGFGVFSPKRRETSRRRDKLQTLERPLFPGYLFVQFDPKQPGWTAVQNTRGVSRILMMDPRAPQPLPEPVMEELIARCDRHEVLIGERGLRKGDTVRVVDGPFANTIARIADMSDDERVRLLLELVGQSANLVIGQQRLQKVRT